MPVLARAGLASHHPRMRWIVGLAVVAVAGCDVATRTCKKQLAVGAACTPQTFGVEDEPCFLVLRGRHELAR